MKPLARPRSPNRGWRHDWCVVIVKRQRTSTRHIPEGRRLDEEALPIKIFNDETITVIAVGERHQRRSLGAVEVAGPGAGPPLHVHQREDEAFDVLKGDYSLFMGNDEIEASPGEWV